MGKRDIILKSALTLFVELGEQASSMKLIAQRANCGIGTMYNYFKSKDELISAIYLQIKTKMFSQIVDDLDREATIKQQFSYAWLSAVNYAIKNPSEYKFLEIFSHSPKISDNVTREVNELIFPIFEIYEKGKQEGVIKNYDTLQMIIFTNGAIASSVLRGSELDEEQKKALVEMAWDAIKLS